MKSNNEYWSDYWLSDGKAGEVFVDRDGKKPDYLRNFWLDQFSKIGEGQRVLDLACGAGSIYEDLSEKQQRGLELTASDLSDAALVILKQRLPEIDTVNCAADSTPFKDGHFDLIVSQFGIEYAGVGAFSEAMRILRSGGNFTFLSHVADGYIDRRNERFIMGASIALTSGFIPAAKNLIEASFEGSKTKIRKTKEQFTIAEKPMAAFIKEYPEGIHNHLYFGFREMYLKFGNYHKHDILGWLDAMEKDIRKNIDKVSAIRKVSLDDTKLSIVVKKLEDSGGTDICVDKFVVPSRPEDHVAWHIHGAKR